MRKGGERVMRREKEIQKKEKKKKTQNDAQGHFYIKGVACEGKTQREEGV